MSCTVTSAPNQRSMFSVWSRVGCGSTTVDTPGALRPANSTADLTWAEATGRAYSMGSGSAAPLTVIGNRPPSRPVNLAPMRSSGAVTRPMGRRQSDASPVKVAVMS